jgi:hypothetical protein
MPSPPQILENIQSGLAFGLTEAGYKINFWVIRQYTNEFLHAQLEDRAASKQYDPNR